MVERKRKSKAVADDAEPPKKLTAAEAKAKAKEWADANFGDIKTPAKTPSKTAGRKKKGSSTPVLKSEDEKEEDEILPVKSVQKKTRRKSTKAAQGSEKEEEEQQQQQEEKPVVKEKTRKRTKKEVEEVKEEKPVKRQSKKAKTVPVVEEESDGDSSDKVKKTTSEKKSRRKSLEEDRQKALEFIKNTMGEKSTPSTKASGEKAPTGQSSGKKLAAKTTPPSSAKRPVKASPLPVEERQKAQSVDVIDAVETENESEVVPSISNQVKLIFIVLISIVLSLISQANSHIGLAIIAGVVILGVLSRLLAFISWVLNSSAEAEADADSPGDN